MKKLVKKYQPGGLVDSEGNPVRDSSGQAIMTGSGREEAEIEAKMAAAQKRLDADVQEKLKADKAKDDADFAAEEARSKTARAVAGAPAKAAPAKKTPIVTKEELAKSGLSLRDYMNKQKGLNRRDGKAPAKSQSSAPVSRARPTPEGSSPKQTMGGSYRNEGRNTPAPKAPEKRAGTALPLNPSLLRQREEDEKRREGRREQSRIRDAEKEAADRKKREEEDRMTPGQRSAARGKGIKEFLGLAKGGSVRGSGIAQRGVRKCKIV